MTLNVAVAGATGYMGAELLRLLAVHPKVRLTAVMASERSAGTPIGRLIPSLRGHLPLTVEALDAERLAGLADCVMVALPYGETHKVVSVLRRHGRRVIDLSSDYRLRNAAEFEFWYKTSHTDPAGLAEAVYGLPELYRKEIAATRLVANPGCYPVGALLAVVPLIKAGLGRPDGIIIDSKTGVTGAGSMSQKPDPMYLYAEANENLQAYNVARHRHTPEIEQALATVVGAPVQVTFTAHLAPMNRGIFTTAYVSLSRARYDARIYTNDSEALRRAASRNLEKAIALDALRQRPVRQAQRVAQEQYLNSLKHFRDPSNPALAQKQDQRRNIRPTQATSYGWKL